MNRNDTISTQGRLIYEQGVNRGLPNELNGIAQPEGRIFYKRVALQQYFLLLEYGTRLDSVLAKSVEEAPLMGLARPINALMICAAFAFIGALVMGIVV